jgi:hypothetical protein
MHKKFVGKHEGKRPLGRHRRRLDNIKMDLKCGVRKWTMFIWYVAGTSGGLL